MKRAFVIGHPIKHSRSPLIHGSWIKAYGVDGSYEAIDVEPADLPAFVQRIRDGEFAGGNVTIPHKEEVFALCDSVDPLAQRIGAVNTLVGQPGGKVHGFNTDFMGFLGNLDQNAPGWSDGLETAMVIGAGGAARAVLVALQHRGIVHPVDMIAGENQHVVGPALLQQEEVLVDRVRRPAVPRLACPHLWRNWRDVLREVRVVDGPAITEVLLQ